MKLGIFGGTFDPVHYGHLEIAEQAFRRLQLAKIVFIPAGQPWLKGNHRIEPAHHRLAMLQLALEGRTEFEVSTVEIEREGPSYSVDTLRIMREGIDAKTELFFILGWDSLQELYRWKQPEELMKLCTLIAIVRPGCKPPDMQALERTVSGISSGTILLEIPPVDISATGIRSRVKAGEPLEGLVPEKVARYIEANGLYR